MFSDEYKQLLSRVNYLNRTFIPVRQKEQTFWGQDKLRAYRLLAHAEIEFYLEQAAEKIIEELRLALENKRQPRRMERIWGQKVLNKQKNIVAENHGIKRANVIALYEPLGISEADFDLINPTLLDRMDELGKYRGHDAHKGVSHRATRTLNARVVKAHVNEVVQGLEGLDKLISSVRVRQFFEG